MVIQIKNKSSGETKRIHKEDFSYYQKDWILDDNQTEPVREESVITFPRKKGKKHRNVEE